MMMKCEPNVERIPPAAREWDSVRASQRPGPARAASDTCPGGFGIGMQHNLDDIDNYLSDLVERHMGLSILNSYVNSKHNNDGLMGHKYYSLN